MEYGIKRSILLLEKTSYAKEGENSLQALGMIDCSNGINPLGISESVENSIRSMSIDTINKYPKDWLQLKDSIIEYWKEVGEINYDMIAFGNGSIELIYKINKLYIENNYKALGYSPQFSDFVDDVKSCGGIYESYKLSIDNNYMFSPNDYIKKMNKEYSLFYIDNPNNPTGQVIDIAYIETIVKKARDLGRPIVIDEAYGDFIGKDQSAIKLVGSYDNLIVLRTFSKGLGLAGVRAGYMVASESIIKQYRKVSNPYEMNGIARIIVNSAIKDVEFMENCKNTIKCYKTKMLESLKKLKILETHESVPISTIMHPDPNVDLEELLLNYNIISVSGRDFIGLGKNFVRLMVNSNIDEIIIRLTEVENAMDI